MLNKIFDRYKTEIENFMGCSYEEDYYYNSWNLIMDVINKIESISVKSVDEEKRYVEYFFQVEIKGNNCVINRDVLPQYYGTEYDFLHLYGINDKDKKHSSQKAIIEFLKWNKKQIK